MNCWQRVPTPPPLLHIFYEDSPLLPTPLLRNEIMDLYMLSLDTFMPKEPCGVFATRLQFTEV